jgi:hypothetical protein
MPITNCSEGLCTKNKPVQILPIHCQYLQFLVFDPIP